MYILKKILTLLAYFIITSYLFPLIKLGSTSSFKLDWFFVKIVLVFLLFDFTRLLKNRLYRRFIILFGLIFIVTIISNYVSGYYYLENLANYRLPLTIIRILDLTVVFIFFSQLIREGVLTYKHVINYISLVFIIGLLFGFFQYFDLFGAKNLAQKLYMEEGGVQEFNFLSFNRILGVAPAIITWGGLCMMTFYFFLFLSSNLTIKIIGTILALFNVLVAASRAAIVAFFISFVLIYLIKVVFLERSFKKLVQVIVVGVSSFLVSILLVFRFLPEQVDFLMRRFEVSGEAMTKTGRGEQLDYFSTLLSEDYFGIVFGMGDSKIVEYGYLEVDYAYIFYAFGIFGFIFHYLLLFFLLKEVTRLRVYSHKIFLFVYASTIGYLVFSIGFYFFYELYMGLVYWWLVGICYGELQRRNALKIE